MRSRMQKFECRMQNEVTCVEAARPGFRSALRVHRSAFSLTEILIVIALIVLLLALALPAFNFITGGRSIDGAMNGMSAFLARARTEAVGVQEMRGVMFYI